jgi:hypothetical protein
VCQADRARDTGRYTIKLTCEAGTFEASANVNVLDVPTKPRNLMPDEIRAEHVKLSWLPPEDDGGTPIQSYLVRYMDIDSGEWVTACTTTTPSATAQGLKPGHLYQFEVSAINKEGQSEPIFTGDPILAENPYSKSIPGRQFLYLCTYTVSVIYLAVKTSLVLADLSRDVDLL